MTDNEKIAFLSLIFNLSIFYRFLNKIIYFILKSIISVQTFFSLNFKFYWYILVETNFNENTNFKVWSS